ncbi:MAG TPA: hypothetical protein VFR56_02820 [Actinomycetes bacterium]|nr:hypothetical protein [Actinomycetes bacterium]
MRWLAVAIGLGLLVGGITAATADQSPKQTAGATGADFGPDGPGPSDSPDPALTGQPVPTLPPGDPGTDAPGTDDPDAGDAGTDEDSDHSDESGGTDGDQPDAGRLTEVPAAALLDVQTVGAVAGGSWSPADPSGDDACPAADHGGAPTRSAVLAADDASGRLVQSVGTWPTSKAARVAVVGLGSALEACGFTPAGDPRLGEASAAFDRTVDGTQQHAVVIAVEGATLVLAGSGSAAAPGAWESLADIAMGSACAAGVHGCH